MEKFSAEDVAVMLADREDPFTCDECSGAGALEPTGKTCPICEGEGVVWDDMA